MTPAGRVRIGGFGGDAGLVDYMREQHIDLLIDATHPFAAHISFNAAHAAQVCGLPHLLLMRPPWELMAGDRWIAVEHCCCRRHPPECRPTGLPHDWQTRPGGVCALRPSGF